MELVCQNECNWQLPQLGCKLLQGGLVGKPGGIGGKKNNLWVLLFYLPVSWHLPDWQQVNFFQQYIFKFLYIIF